MKLNMLSTSLLAAALITGCSTAGDGKPAMSMAHAHMGHVSQSWGDTPNKAGLLQTAVAEARIAHQHAGFAAKKPDDLGWMKLHTTHVMHALEPSSMAKGPGLGYGLIKAANGAAKHITLAADSKDASANVKAHAVHVATSAGNGSDWSNEVMTLAKQVESANSAAEAAPKVAQIAALTQRIIDGFDANGDGQITWVKGEGGLMEADKHMGIMYRGEELTKPAI
jgi:hypothetical protein